VDGVLLNSAVVPAVQSASLGGSLFLVNLLLFAGAAIARPKWMQMSRRIAQHLGGHQPMRTHPMRVAAGEESPELSIGSYKIACGADPAT